MIDTLPAHHLSRVLSLLRRDLVVAFPTGTTYGFGVNALSSAALRRLTDLKGRSEEKTYSLLLPEKDSDTYVELADPERAVLRSFTGQPLTLLVRSHPALAHLAKEGRVGVRTTDHPFTRELSALLPFPITATSANPSGKPPAFSVEEIQKSFPGATFMVVDGGGIPKRKPSTVARWDDGTWTVLREGDIHLTALKQATATSSAKNETPVPPRGGG